MKYCFVALAQTHSYLLTATPSYEQADAEGTITKIDPAELVRLNRIIAEHALVQKEMLSFMTDTVYDTAFERQLAAAGFRSFYVDDTFEPLCLSQDSHHLAADMREAFVQVLGLGEWAEARLGRDTLCGEVIVWREGVPEIIHDVHMDDLPLLVSRLTHQSATRSKEVSV